MRSQMAIGLMAALVASWACLAAPDFAPWALIAQIGAATPAIPEKADSTTDQRIRSLEGHDNVIGAVAFSPDGKTLVSGSFDQRLKL
jgi:hypothetical protein